MAKLQALESQSFERSNPKTGLVEHIPALVSLDQDDLECVCVCVCERERERERERLSVCVCINVYVGNCIVCMHLVLLLLQCTFFVFIFLGQCMAGRGEFPTIPPSQLQIQPSGRGWR